ncbi:hypothetical protein CERSUDRAFT_117056 [Gelatoporia subvermispora B]|uniref:Uncharacterized protein n=1 Tax=Ceriporiopsis subvermispora (strain B) TaxID=914234 RepID=M2R8U6_CERS8|nr:hypothetical protein CERSUDRAFT_117056 [Gelatoporia subvermispora B]
MEYNIREHQVRTICRIPCPEGPEEQVPHLQHGSDDYAQVSGHNELAQVDNAKSHDDPAVNTLHDVASETTIPDVEKNRSEISSEKPVQYQAVRPDLAIGKMSDPGATTTIVFFAEVIGAHRDIYDDGHDCTTEPDSPHKLKSDDDDVKARL